MLLLRALNEYDIVSNPDINGIASKEMIYNLVKSYYESIQDKEYMKLNSKEKDQSTLAGKTLKLKFEGSAECKLKTTPAE